jgi:hypothetical protein
MSEHIINVEQVKLYEGSLRGFEAHRLLTYRPLGSGGGVGVWWELSQAAKLFNQPGLSLWLPYSEIIEWKVDEQEYATISFQETTSTVMFHDEQSAQKGVRAEQTSTEDRNLTFNIAPDGTITYVFTPGKETPDNLEKRIASRRNYYAKFSNVDPDPAEVNAMLQWDLPDREVVKRLVEKLQKDGGNVPIAMWVYDMILQKAGNVIDGLV